MNLPIVQKSKLFFTISATAVLVAIIALATFGLKPGIDFTGGSLMEISFTGDLPSHEAVQNVFADNTYGNVVVQQAGDNGY